MIHVGVRSHSSFCTPGSINIVALRMLKGCNNEG
jgi:hypothetical protein